MVVITLNTKPMVIKRTSSILTLLYLQERNGQFILLWMMRKQNRMIIPLAGILNENRTVLGLMPHPERLADPALGGNDGRAMFDGLVKALS